MAHIWWGPVVLRGYFLPAASLISGLFTRPSLRRMRLDRRLRYREPHVVGDPRGQLSWTQLRHLPGRRQHVVDYPQNVSLLIRSVGLVGRLENKSTDHKARHCAGTIMGQARAEEARVGSIAVPLSLTIYRSQRP